MANDLNLPAIADGQAAGQWQTSNDGDAALGNAFGDIYTVDFTAGNVTLTSAQFRSAFVFVAANLSATRTLTLPAVKRPFAVYNPDATYSVNVTKGATVIEVGPGQYGRFHTDGTTDGLAGAVSDEASGGGGDDSSVGKHTIWLPASALTPATTAGCAALVQLESSSNKINYGVLDFDATADEHAHFNIAFPKSWNEGTVTFQVWWTTSATDTDGVAWGIQGVAVSDNEAIDTAFGTPVVVTDDAQSAALELLVTAESAAVTIGGTPAAGDLCYFRIFRDVSDGNDDMAEDARLIGVKIFYTTDAGNDS
ncbi:hypothetical protein [Mesorhizobium sp.]|uniref:hypothetical protein n=1 Tax=Mesorhizobium sp. TaxID=1871066 RepID=UPI0011F9C7DA|nr:hypothetical protein [Mesorhizobium sp.]TIL64496.1 MAG: hypothetical protein E5Y77_26280 [Mesorhizobium sp.]